jgi:dihydroneopterin aldolase
MHDGHIIVVKLGGSLTGSRHLVDWVGALASCGGRSVVVPGGGPFADAVRQAQAKIGFSDSAAHHLALIAMEQFGWALASLNPNFRVADSAIAIGNALRAGNVPIWSPVKMVLDCREIPASWDVTSDSLAAWLAGQIGARQIVLVKHGAAFGNPPSVVDLAARGIVDQAFPRFLASSGAQASIVAAEASGSAQKAISERGMPGTLIGLHDRVARRLLAPLWPRSNSRVGDGH